MTVIPNVRNMGGGWLYCQDSEFLPLTIASDGSFFHAMLMRLRLPELLDERGITAYSLSKQSKGRISMSTAYRLAKMNGRVQNFDADMLEALCDVLKCQPGDLLEREPKGRRKYPIAQSSATISRRK